MLNFKTIIALFFILFSQKIYSQTISNTSDFVYVANIKSVKFYSSSNPLTYPISDMSGSISLNFSFDDLDGDTKSYYYKIVHCDMDWNISDLNESEYIQGFNGVEIKNVTNSEFTLKQYTHYNLRLPNNDIKWLISGNYLLVVYDDQDEVIITKRFLVSENVIKINSYLDHTKDVTKYYTHHNLFIDLNIKDYYIVDPIKEIKVFALQNYRWDDAIKKISPKHHLGNDVKFDEFDPFSFKALNEFNYFDIRSLRATNLEVKSIDIKRKGVEIKLEKDNIRKYGNYFLHNDINGNFLVLNLDNHSENGSQYANVFFTLESHAPIKDSEVFVTGGFCEWQLYDENKLTYNKETESYEGTILLKQGVYDYYYAVRDASGKIDYEPVEGSWYETENDYLILVYQKPFGGKYDKLIGIRIIE